MRTTPPIPVRPTREDDVPTATRADRAAIEATLADADAFRRGGRPAGGLAAAVGITSIVIGGLTLFVVGVKILFLLVAVGTMGAPALATGGNQFDPDNAVGVVIEDDDLPAVTLGLGEENIDAAIAGLSDAAELDEAHVDQLRLLLDQHGMKVFPNTGDGLTAEGVAASVTDTGSDGDERFIVLPSGTVLLNPGGASFTDTAMVTFTVDPDEVDSPENMYGAFPAFDPEDIDEAVFERLLERIEQDTGPLTAAQEKAIYRDALASTSGVGMFQWWWNGMEPAGLVTEAGRLADAEPGADPEAVYVYTDRGRYVVNADGSATIQATGGLPAEPAARTGAVVAAGAEGLALALSGLLIAAGIQTLRGKPSGRMLHLLHMGLKLLAGAMAFYGWWVFTRDWPGGSNASGTVTALLLVAGGVLWALVSGGLHLAGPLAKLR